MAIPLVALAASGHDLRVLPAYEYRPLHGDSFGFYAATREFIAAFGVVPPAVLAALGLAVVVAVTGAWTLFRRGLRWQACALTAVTVALVAAPVVDRMELSGAAVFGWSFLWALPMLPYRALGLPLGPDVAFGFGLVLSLVANAAAVVATGYLGFHATGRRAAGLVAAGLFALWPLLTRPLAGTSAWENGQWSADVGLHLYTEPLSTALVAIGLALLLSPKLEELRLALAGVALGYATFTKLSNVLIAAVAVALAAWWLGPRRILPLCAGGLAVVPLIAVYWVKGYPAIAVVPGWSPAFVRRNWADSLLFDPRVLFILLVPALAGAFGLRRSHALALLGGTILVTAAQYSFYEVTYLHPRFLYAALPSLFVLQAAAAVSLGARLRRDSRLAGLARRRSPDRRRQPLRVE